MAPLGPPAPTQEPRLGHEVAPPGRRPWCQACGCSSRPPPLASGAGWFLSAAAPDLGPGVAPPGRHPWPWTRGKSSQLFLCRRSLALSVTAPDLGRGVAPLGCAECTGRSCPRLVTAAFISVMTRVYAN